MREDLFELWLRNVDARPEAQVRDNLSRARRIEKAGWNLDDEYDLDRCNTLLSFLVVGNPGLTPRNLPADASGLSSLKTCIRKYVSFRDSYLR